MGISFIYTVTGSLCLKWSSVLELSRVTLQFWVSTGFVYKKLAKWCKYGRRHYLCEHVIIGTHLLKLPTQRNSRCVELHRQVKQTDVAISYRQLLKPKKCHKTMEFRFEVVIVLVFVNRKKHLIPSYCRSIIGPTRQNNTKHYYAPPLIGGGLKRYFCLTSDVCLTSVCRVHRASDLSRPPGGL